jgi:hypothetical protein
MIYGRKAGLLQFDEFNKPTILISGRGQSKIIIPYRPRYMEYYTEMIKSWKAVFTINAMKGITK